MNFAVRSSSYSKKRAQIPCYSSRSKDPEIDAYIQTLVQRITDLETEVFDLKGKLRNRETWTSSYSPEKPSLRAGSAPKDCGYSGKKPASKTAKPPRVRDIKRDHSSSSEESKLNIQEALKAHTNQDRLQKKPGLPYMEKPAESNPHTLIGLDAPTTLMSPYFDLSDSERHELEQMIEHSPQTKKELCDNQSYRVVLRESQTDQRQAEPSPEKLVPRKLELRGLERESNQNGKKSARDAAPNVVFSSKLLPKPPEKRIKTPGCVQMKQRRNKENISFEAETVPFNTEASPKKSPLLSEQQNTQEEEERGQTARSSTAVQEEARRKGLVKKFSCISSQLKMKYLRPLAEDESNRYRESTQK
jgi:hypothetical protein